MISCSKARTECNGSTGVWHDSIKHDYMDSRVKSQAPTSTEFHVTDLVRHIPMGVENGGGGTEETRLPQ